VRLQAAPTAEKKSQEKLIQDLLNSDLHLRSKKELIEKFIQKNLPLIENPDDVIEAFENFVEEERKEAIQEISKEEALDQDKLEHVIGEYLFTDKQPLREDIVALMIQKPSLKERSTKIERVTHKIYDFVNTFISGFAR
ncbi:type I restriction endonuclease subunit R, EcoR124 family, partial [Paenimyroides tangerinum]